MLALYLQRLQPKSLWHGAGLRLLMLSVVVAVAAMSAVGLFSDRVEKSLDRQGATLLAADLVIQQGREIPPEWVAKAQQLNLKTSQIVSFPSVVFYQQQPQLVQVKAVDAAYPLRGKLQLEGASGAPPQGVAYVDTRLFAQMSASLGETQIPFGDMSLQLKGIVHIEPDRNGTFFQLAPRLMVSLADANKSGLLGPASRAKYRLLVAGNAAGVSAFREWIESKLPTYARILDVENARPEFKAALDRGKRFLNLAALCATLLAGVAIMLATRRYVALALDGAAVMRSMGMTAKQVLKLHLFELFVATLLATLFGIAFAFAAQSLLVDLFAPAFAATLPLPGLQPLLVAVVFGVVVVLGFAVPSLLSLAKVSPLRVLRRDLAPASLSSILVWLLAFICFFGLVLWQVQDVKLAVVVIGGLLATMLVLLLLAYLLMLGIKRLPKGNGSGGVAFGLTALMRAPSLTLLQLVGFSFGIMIVLLLSLVRIDLLNTWQATLPVETPNHFLINIQPEEKAAVSKWLADNQIDGSGMYATTRGRLLQINDKKVTPEDYIDSRAKKLASREYSLGFAAEKQADNRISQGAWWNSDEANKPGFSLEIGFAEALDIRIGDQLIMDVAGQKISGPVSSIRHVSWDSFNVNFFIAATPFLMKDLPVAYISSIYLEDTHADLVAELAANYPAVSVLDLRPILEQVRSVIEQGALAIQAVFFFTLLAAIMVTLTAIQVSKDQRAQEVAVLRTLGASRSLIQRAVITEFGLMGLLSGFVAASLSSAINYVLAAQLFDLSGHFNFALWLFGALLGILLVGIVGLMATRRLIHTSPMQVLKRI